METLSPARKQEFDSIARSRLIVCPSCEDALLAELMDADELKLRVAGFGSLPKIEARLLQLGGRLRVLLPLPYRGHTLSKKHCAAPAHRFDLWTNRLTV